ncbi:MAG TPA: VWA domain-containing protein [Terracidiphilus sp.]|jgi:VWFA-related protein
MRTGKSAALGTAVLILLLAIATSAEPMPAQSTAATPVPELPVIDKIWPDVNLNAVALGKDGAAQIIDVHLLRLFEDGAERPLHFLGSPDSPVSVALVIDSSGSIYKRKPAIVAAVTAIVTALPPDSEVMAVLFADQSYLDLPFTPASKVDFSFLDRLQARGPTALFDSIVATENHFIAHAKYVRRAMVVLSDGIDNASNVSMAEVSRAMEQPGAPVVYVCPPSKANILKMQRMDGQIYMSFLARWGGGVAFYLDPDPAAAAAKVVSAIRSQMVVQFTAANPARNGKRRKLKLQFPDNNLQVRAVPEYFAPAK